MKGLTKEQKEMIDEWEKITVEPFQSIEDYLIGNIKSFEELWDKNLRFMEDILGDLSNIKNTNE